MTLLVRARRRDQQLLAFGLSEHYRQIFDLTRLDEAVGIHESEADAIAAHARPKQKHRPRAAPMRSPTGRVQRDPEVLLI